MLLFAAAIGIGTFIENDFGTSAAQKVVYKSGWFSALLIMFCITIIVNIIRFKMIKQKKWATLSFHLAIIIILIGAGVTRYFGFEGMMHIRENSASNSFLSADTYLQFSAIKNDQRYDFSEPVLFASLGNNHWEQSYKIGNDLIEIEVKDFIPNPVQLMTEDPNGPATIKIVFAGNGGREEYFLQNGNQRNIRNVPFNFGDEEFNGAVNIKYVNDSILIKYDKVLFQTVMATQKLDTLVPGGNYFPLRLRSLYSDGTNSFVFGDFLKNAQVGLSSEGKKVKSESLTALKTEVRVNGKAQELLVYGQKGVAGRPVVAGFDALNLSVSYGAKPISLPFSIKLYDFILQRYPGTNSAESYASEVQLIDDRENLKMDYRIFMNNILDHDGYRFFQSSYDQDEAGTYLSVNHDFWGTWISYFGYALLTVGMVLSLFSKKSRFYSLSQKMASVKSKSAVSLAILLSLGSISVSAQKELSPVNPSSIVSAAHADAFSKIVVQDNRGRMKPVHTLSREIMRKLARTESLYGLNADQILLSMFADSRSWIGVPIIALGKHEKVHQLLNSQEKLLAYRDFFAQNGEYLLRDEVRRAYSLKPIDRGVYEKDIMKIDERVNILNMVLSGHILKIIPVANDPNNTWVSSHDTGEDQIKNEIADKFFDAYSIALAEALVSKNYSLPNTILAELDQFQRTTGAAVRPSDTQLKAEVFLNNLNVFNRLALSYVLLGLAFLFLLFYGIFKPNASIHRVSKIVFILLAVSFFFHTLGLGLRWYVSERAPWSNGYESMIYIAWTTMLAGMIFTRKSLGGLAATSVLAATILLVASLSYLDPEITPLVPVLKSYWLTIHVSLEAGSYGFLMLGAFIGLLNLILMIFLNKENHTRIERIIVEMNYLSEMTLIAGLTMISIGTYLGGVWANESWGRYWGWDAKETWALVTILVYAFILHMRFIPKLQGIFAYNLATIFGWGSVIMTYYGVNYYLSGLHSYAAGDPVPIPQWVYIVVISVFVVAILAYWRKRPFKKIS